MLGKKKLLQQFKDFNPSGKDQSKENFNFTLQNEENGTVGPRITIVGWDRYTFGSVISFQPIVLFPQ